MNVLIRNIKDCFAASGKVEWIGFRSAHRAPMTIVQSARLIAGRGIEGDHRAVKGGGKRQVTLIQQENLPTIAKLAGIDQVVPDALRRNFVVSGINLCALIGRYFQIDNVVLQGSGDCHPCARMAEALGEGWYNAMRGYGGINAIVCEGGEVTIGSAVTTGAVIHPE